MFKFFLGSVFRLRGTMGTDLRTAGQLRVTLGSLHWNQNHLNHWPHRCYHCFICIITSIFSSFFQFSPATFPKELPLYCFFMQMETLNKIFLFLGFVAYCWGSCQTSEHFHLRSLNLKVKQEVSVKVVLVNRLLFGLYEALAGCRGGQGEELPSCRDNRTLQTPRPPPPPPPDVTAPIAGVAPSWTAVVASSLYRRLMPS